jgi:hypothetical protein
MPACARLSDTPRLLADHTKRESDEISNGFREIHTFSGIAIKRPLIDAMTGTGNSSVFGTLFRAPDCHTFLAECSPGPRKRTKLPEIGCRIRTVFGTRIPSHLIAIAPR